jgi:hypothetical protein
MFHLVASLFARLAVPKPTQVRDRQRANGHVPARVCSADKDHTPHL